MSMETISILEQISRDKGIDKDILIDALKLAVEVAARKGILRPLSCKANSMRPPVKLKFTWKKR